MSNDLIEFRWPIRRAGYRWVTARSIDQPEEPEPLGEVATEEERKSYRRALFDSRPRQFLTDGIPFGVHDDAVDVRRPLQDQEGRLHRLFAEVDPTPDGILKFANGFGMLGNIEELIQFDALASEQEAKKLSGYGEDLNEWISEIQDMKLTVAVWDLLQSDNEQVLSNHFNWAGDAVEFRWEKSDRKVYITALCRELHPALMERTEPGNYRVPALKVVQMKINDRLSARGRATPKMLHNLSTDRLEHHIVPNSLIGAIWLDFALSVDGNKKYRKCAECGTAFPAGGRGHEKRFCSDKCRVAQNRKLKKA